MNNSQNKQSEKFLAHQKLQICLHLDKKTKTMHPVWKTTVHLMTWTTNAAQQLQLWTPGLGPQQIKGVSPLSRSTFLFSVLAVPIIGLFSYSRMNSPHYAPPIPLHTLLWDFVVSSPSNKNFSLSLTYRSVIFKNFHHNIQQALSVKKKSQCQDKMSHTHVNPHIQIHRHLCWLEVQRPVCSVY